MAKYKEPMGVKKTAKKAKKAKEDIISSTKKPSTSTRALMVKNTRGAKSPEITKGGFISETATRAMQARREGERTRTASRAAGIAARQKKVAQARRQKKSLGN
jgi:hypothetical protein